MSTMRIGESWKKIAACAAFWLAAVPATVAGQDILAPPTGIAGETKNRLTQERMDELVSGPVSIVERRGLPAGRAAFERLLARTRAARGARSAEVADLLTSFGIGLHMVGSNTDDRQLQAESIPYLEAAIAAYRAAFGDAHPEVALALNTYADAQIALDRENPPPSAEAALEEAYRIRLRALGPTNLETLTNLRHLAMLRSLPSQIRGEPGRIEAAAALFRELIARSPNQAQPEYVTAPAARTALARMYAQNRMPNEAREQLRLAIEQTRTWPEEERCAFAAVETDRLESLLAGDSGGMRDHNTLIMRCFLPEGEGRAPPAR